MDWMCKVVLTVGSVAMVLAMAQRCGRGAAGFLAGLPTTTAPALAWVAHDHGAGFAANTALVTVGGCAMLAAFALVYVHAARRGGRGLALAGGAFGALLLALPSLATRQSLLAAVGLATLCCSVALWAWPRLPLQRPCPAPRMRSTLVLSTAAGGFSAGVSLAAPSFGVVATGLLSSLPVVSATVAAAEHAAGGAAAVSQFLRGYVTGLFGRIAFGAVFAVSIGALDLAWALALAALCACVVNLAALHWLARRDGVLPPRAIAVTALLQPVPSNYR
jgi:hypothetical protein